MFFDETFFCSNHQVSKIGMIQLFNESLKNSWWIIHDSKWRHNRSFRSHIISDPFSFSFMLLCFTTLLLATEINVIKSNILIETPQVFEFILGPGQYFIECFGAQGGSGFFNGKKYADGGDGAYTSGTLNIKNEEILFFATTGGEGIADVIGKQEGGFNGGGMSGESKAQNSGPGSGGGATDFRIYNNSLSNRIMVAAGGSGGVAKTNGAPGGDLQGKRRDSNSKIADSQLTNQLIGGANGIGGDGIDSSDYAGSGGGGGYFGGVSTGESGKNGVSNTFYKAIAHSGSSYVSGYPGCVENELMQFSDPQIINGKDEPNKGHGKFQLTVNYLCIDDCVDCSDGTTCNKCKDGFRYSIEDAKCYDKCPDKTYENGEYCSPCSQECATCISNPKFCLTCSDSYYFYQNVCYESCPPNTFQIEDHCEICSDDCDQCIDAADKCSSCKDKTYLYKNKCYSSCSQFNDPQNNQYYGKNDQDLRCDTCLVENCIECSEDYTKCTMCSDLYYYNEEFNQCFFKPTKAFSQSSFFTYSKHFTQSYDFSASEMFTKHFTNSKYFTESNYFTHSHTFSQSNSFTSSNLLPSSLGVVEENMIQGNPGTYKIFLKAGKYKVTCKGAQGGQAYYNSNIKGDGGDGSSVTGTMHVKGDLTPFYINVGGKGTCNIDGGQNGGYNGGGKAGKSRYGNAGPGSGGGATDIRIYNNQTRSRIMVAAGGSGGVATMNGAPGGDLAGRCRKSNGDVGVSAETNQENGNIDGIGGNGVDSDRYAGSGGGGGYRGGISTNIDAPHGDYYLSMSHSGSSYVSGHEQCIKNEDMSFTDITINSGTTDPHKGDGEFTLEIIFKCMDNCIDCDDTSTCNQCSNGYIYREQRCYFVTPTPIFTKSSAFSKSASFSFTQEFSETFIFSQSFNFSNSLGFTDSNSFTKSTIFSETIEFSQSVKFTSSHDFTESNSFSMTGTHSPTSVFSASSHDVEAMEIIEKTKSNISTVVIIVSAVFGVIIIALSIIMFIIFRIAKQRKKEVTSDFHAEEMALESQANADQVTLYSSEDRPDIFDNDDPFESRLGNEME